MDVVQSLSLSLSQERRRVRMEIHQSIRPALTDQDASSLEPGVEWLQSNSMLYKHNVHGLEVKSDE